MLALVDNYDSFTYNVVHLAATFDPDVVVYRNDSVTVDELLYLDPCGLLVSPGPCTPDQAGIANDAIRRLHGRIPILGICLGHQCVVAAFGGAVVRAPYPEHGKVWPVEHEGSRLLAGLPSPFDATRYHSLVADPTTIPDGFRVTAWCSDGTIMAVEHEEHPTFGVQFHPESVRTVDGARLMETFVGLCRERRAATASGIPG